MRLLGKTTDFWWKEFVLLKNQDSWKKRKKKKQRKFWFICVSRQDYYKSLCYAASFLKLLNVILHKNCQ